MGYAINGRGYHLDMCYTKFKCPSCSKQYDIGTFMKKINNSKTGFIYITCKECNNKLGVTMNMMGDPVVWLKSEENKS